MTLLRAEELVGLRLESVHYDVFEWDSPPVATAVVDTVPGCVALGLQERAFTLCWELKPPTEQLVLAPVDVVDVKPLMRRIDVSDRWSTFIGAELGAAMWSYHETGDGVQPWAITLSFGEAGDMVVALGELSADSPRYIPDSLIVTAAVEVARAYKPVAALGAAWADTGDETWR